MKKFIYILSFLLIIPISFILVACDNNSNPEKTSEGFTFELSLDMNSYTISGIGDCTDKDIAFPSSYNGLPIIAKKKRHSKTIQAFKQLQFLILSRVLGKMPSQIVAILKL